MILQKIKNIFWKSNKKEAESIKWFQDALDWVKTYEKIKDYKNAILSIRELILKHRTMINYNDNLIKKLYTLETSNIKEVSDKASEKLEKVRSLNTELSKRISILEKRLSINEENSKKEADLYKKKMNAKIYKQAEKDIKEFISKKEFSKALTQAKKLVLDFQDNKEAIRLLNKVQILFNNDKSKSEKEIKKTSKADKILSDIWVKVKKENEGKWIFKKISEMYKNQLWKSQKKKEDIKRLKTLSELEKILVNSWTINNIEWDKYDNKDYFSVISSGLTKDVEWFNLQWFNVFWKIIWKDKIIGDTFWSTKNDNWKAVFYIWDATGHWVQSWFVVALLSKLFFDHSKKIKNFKDLFLKINNELKEKIKWRMFITSVFFEWDFMKNTLSTIWAGHIPIFIYRKEQNKIERFVAWWLALWVRMINNVSSIKIKDIELGDWDVVFLYTDWIIETKDAAWVMFWINRLEEAFTKVISMYSTPKKIYENLLKEVNDYKLNSSFDDDVTIIILSRDKNKDIITNKEELNKILQEANVKRWNIQVKKQTKEEVIEKIKKEKYDRELKIRLQRLDRLHNIWEYIKLKQDVLMYYKEWFVHDKMKYYLEKAIWNEQKVIMRKQEEKLQKKYTVLQDLYKKWEYEIVIKEVLDVIYKWWKI